VPRPSSPVYAKASTNCPYLTLENPHHHRQPCEGSWPACMTGADITVVWLYTDPPNARDGGSAQLDNQLFVYSIPSLRPETATASISRTHSQCQRSRLFASTAGHPADLGFHIGNWWSQSGSNRRPQACKASALPTELWPLWIKPACEPGGPSRS
jgi:hypothetical protein